MDKISVIVPVYNVEKYIEKSIISIINQSYTDIEIIVVNDGSTDDSIKICELLSKKDSRISIYNKENGGLSSARNFGMNFATGKYVIFIDSDDYIDKDMLAELYGNITKYDADVSVCGIYNVYSGKTVPQNDDTNIFFECAKEDFIREYLIGKFPCRRAAAPPCYCHCCKR